MGSHLGDPIRPSLNPVTAVLVARDVLGNAQAVPVLSPSLRKPDLASLRKCAYWGVELSTEKKFPGPRLRKFLRTQQILLSIGALICLTLWALHIQSPFVLVLVNAVVVGNVLSAVMDYACPLNNRLTPPWNWVVYVPLLGVISILGILLAAASLYHLMGSLGVTYRSLLRITAPFGMVVSMAVGVVWYGVERIQVHTADASPASVCAKLKAFLCGNAASGKFISFFYFIVDARDRSLAYENAGHCPGQLVRRTGETIVLIGEGAVLGVLPDWNYRNKPSSIGKAAAASCFHRRRHRGGRRLWNRVRRGAGGAGSTDSIRP
jgi:hypothetical protein